jgi:DNA invertase Pin-like site-specific DNA recombinase
MNGKFIAYYRVSTARQGESGLGLEAQKHAVVSYLNGGKWQLLEEFTEVESGKNSKRPQLAAAMAAAKKAKATLIIAKLDRFSRKLHFISSMMESGINFLAVDRPDADRFTLHLEGALAEREALKISERTKAALAAAKARGTKLGTNGAKLAKQNKTAANQFAANLKSTVHSALSRGLTRAEIAAEFNRTGIPTARPGSSWHSTTIQNLIKRQAAM